MKLSFAFEKILTLFCFVVISNFAYAGGFDYPVEESYSVPGSYAGRSFYYDEEHIGEDIYVPEGTPIRAIADGRIVHYGYAPGYATSNDGTSIAAVKQPFIIT